MKFFSTQNFLYSLAFLAILHCFLECFELSNTQRITLIILTCLEIRFFDFFMKKADGEQSEDQQPTIA